MRRISMTVLALFSAAVLAAGQNAAQKYVEQLKTTDELREAVWGIRAVKVGGGGVAEYNSRTRMMPASNVKVFTTGLALNELGSGYRFRTRLAYSGSIEGGVLKGDLYIVGGGDPTIGARDSVAFALQKTFSEWEKMVRAAGIKSIEGYIVGDGRWLDCEPQNVSWQLEDAATGDGTVMTGLGFGGGLQAFTVAPGAKVGDPVKVTRVLKSAFGYPAGGRTDGLALMEFPETNVVVRTACEMPGGILSRRLRVDGTNGTVDLCPIERFDGEELTLVLTLREAAGGCPAGRQVLRFGVQTDRYEGQLRELAAVVRGERPNGQDYDRDLRVHELTLKMVGIE